MPISMIMSISLAQLACIELCSLFSSQSWCTLAIYRPDQRCRHGWKQNVWATPSAGSA